MGKFLLGLIVGFGLAFATLHWMPQSPMLRTGNTVMSGAAASFSEVLGPGAKMAAVLSFFAAIGVLVLFTLVSEGGFRGGELSVIVTRFFGFWLVFFLVAIWLLR